MANELVRRKKAPAPPEMSQDEQSSLLSQAGGAAMSGLHTLGSALSWPSRLLHGGINAATGGEGGFGENYLNPLDSRGGIEGSQHLIRSGILAKNDPSKWEWGDLGRGLADMALDPTTYAGPGLAKSGLKAAKAGTLASGRIAQTAAGHRALLNFGLPFAEPAVSIGTGPRTARALEAIGKHTGLTRVSNAVKKSLPIRLARAGFDYTVQGLTHPTLQKHVPESVKSLFGMNKGTESDIVRAARSMQADGVDPDLLRMKVEGVAPSKVTGGYTAHPSAATAPFDEEHVMMHVSPHAIGDAIGQLPDAGNHLDDVLQAGGAVPAPVLHLGPNGQVVAGGLASKHAEKLARREYVSARNAMKQRLNATPSHLETTHSKILRVMDEIESGAPMGALVSARDIRHALPGISKTEIDSAIMDLASNGHLQGHHHDFAAGMEPDELAQLIDTGMDIHPNHGRYWVGVAKPRDAAPLPHAMALTPNPEHAAISADFNQFKRSKQATVAANNARILAETHAAHGADEGLSTISKVLSLNEPGMGVMVPKSQARAFERQFGMKNKVARDAGLEHPELDNVIGVNAKNLEQQRAAGVGNQSDLHDVHEHFARRASITEEAAAAGAVNRSSKVLPGKSAEDVGREGFLKGNYEGTVGTNKVLGDSDIHAAIESGGWKAAVPLIRQKYGHVIQRLNQSHAQRTAVDATQRRVATIGQALSEAQAKRAAQEGVASSHAIGTTIDRVNELKGKYDAAVAAHNKALVTGKDRIKQLSQYAAAHPELNGQKLFGNHPLVDLKLASLSSNKKVAMSPAVYKTIAEHLGQGDQSVKLGEFLKSGGFNVRTASEKIAGQSFDEPGSLKKFLSGATIDSKLAQQLQSLAPKFTSPEAVNEAKKALSSGMAWWKGLTLAFPASRARDAIGGVVQNMLHGWVDPRFLVTDTNRLLSGKIVTRDYSHVPEVADWLKKSGNLPATPENQTEALRQLVAVHLPSEHNMLADVPTGQVGAGLEQLTHNVPGQKPTSFTKQFVTDPLKTFVGRGDSGATWTGAPRQPSETIIDRTIRGLQQPFTGVRGVGDRAETTFAPVKASELVSSASDAYNRAGPFLQQLHGGTAADVAAQNVNRAQVNYDPSTFTAVERGIKNTLMPFYSFNSRMLPETARQLSDFGSPTSQLVKGLNRAQGNDPSLPDYALSGTATPLGTADDGTKKVLGTSGLMHEGATSLLGLGAAAAAGDPRAARAAGYDVLGMLNPLVGIPLQRITGQSFFQRGTPLESLDPTTGRLMSNIGESLGVRDADQGPVRYPGARAVDAVLGGTPFGRLASTARTLADPRKDIVSKLVDSLTGAKISDISPGQQLNTLQKRAEDLARSEGAFESRMVGFPKEKIAELAQSNPELAARQMELQQLLTNIKRRKVAHTKMNKAATEAKKLVRKAKSQQTVSK